MKAFRQLKVWEKAHVLTLEICKITKKFPSDELYGLTSQLRRASASIAANIAEGCGRNGDAELARFIHIASGSASETEYHLLRARDLGCLPIANYTLLNDLLCEIRRMLTAFAQTVKLPADR
jgi:four helix bundle protein